MSMLGTRIIESLEMVLHHEDWSGCRSPSRARRRLAYGFPQRVKRWTTPKNHAITHDNGRTFIMHPIFAAELRRQTQARLWSGRL